MSNYNTLAPATIQARIKTPCSCKYCTTPHYSTYNFKLIIEKSDDHYEGRQNYPDFPHNFWRARYVFDGSFSLSEKPKWFDDQDLEKAIIGAKEELEKYIENCNK
jgi:hypothetical protein